MQQKHELLCTSREPRECNSDRLPLEISSPPHEVELQQVRDPLETCDCDLRALNSDKEVLVTNHQQPWCTQSNRPEEVNNQHNYSMDDLFEHVLSMPSWSEAVSSMAARTTAWDYNSLVSTSGLGVDSLAPLHTAIPKLFKTSLMPLDDESIEACRSKAKQGMSSEDARSGDDLQFQNDELLGDQNDVAQGMRTQSSSVIGSGMLPNHDTNALESDQTVSGLLSLLRMPEDGNITGNLALQSNTSPSLGGNAAAASNIPMMPGSGIMRRGAISLAPSRSVGSSGSEGSTGQQLPSMDYQSSLPLIAQSWQQPTYNNVGGVSISVPLPLSLSQTQAENFIAGAETATNDQASIFGKRYRGEEQAPARDHSSNTTQEPHGVIFNPYGGAQGNQAQPARTFGQASHQQTAPGQGGGVPVPVFGVQGSIGQNSQAAANNSQSTGAPRPRVRARRGQATDPHSIAERLRRERIADRMKWLQELVPNANKTDKASMLDEIIDYVKFLQLQVKVLSMSRMGGAGVVAPFVSDLPSEGNSTFGSINLSSSTPVVPSDVMTEREVARLMEQDMGTAMQFLQSKGLCLMPIALATAISSKGGKLPAINQAEKNRMEPSTMSSISASSGPVIGNATTAPVSIGGNSVTNGIKPKPAGLPTPKDYKDSTPASDRSCETPQSQAISAKSSAAKNSEDNPRRNY